MSKLTRITKLRHLVFRDFVWRSNFHSSGTSTSSTARNGCGKTTLPSRLSLLEKETALSEGVLEVEFDGTTEITGAELVSKPVPQVRVSNRYFIKVTIADPGHDLPLLTEAQPVLVDVLALMEPVDKDHYEELKKLVAPSNGFSSTEPSVTHTTRTASEVA